MISLTSWVYPNSFLPPQDNRSNICGSMTVCMENFRGKRISADSVPLQVRMTEKIWLNYVKPHTEERRDFQSFSLLIRVFLNYWKETETVRKRVLNPVPKILLNTQEGMDKFIPAHAKPICQKSKKRRPDMDRSSCRSEEYVRQGLCTMKGGYEKNRQMSPSPPYWCEVFESPQYCTCAWLGTCKKFL